jgi:alpha-1,2-mannosyltransferase
MSETYLPRWSLVKTAGWLAVFVATLAVYLPGYRGAFASHGRVGDFFQEWASARNYFERLPIYTPQELTAKRYLNYTPDRASVFVRMNGHPPACVLVGLPLGRLPYATAFLVWNLVSLGLLMLTAVLVMRHEFGRAPWTYWLPMGAMLASNSFLQHVLMGQLSILIGLLLVLTALAECRGRSIAAGLLLGTAAALKLFPLLLVIYFVINRRYAAIVATMVAFAAWNGAAAAVLGVEAFDHYVHYAMPEVLRYRDYWTNFSITGIWFKLFDGSNGHVVPVIASRLIAEVGAWVSIGLVLLLAVAAAFRARGDSAGRTSSLALLITATTLVSPVTWDHYFMLLIWPAARLIARLTGDDPMRRLATAALAVLWMNPVVLHTFGTRRDGPALPWQTLTFDSWPFYGLVVLFVAGIYLTLLDADRVDPDGDADRAEPVAVKNDECRMTNVERMTNVPMTK